MMKKNLVQVDTRIKKKPMNITHFILTYVVMLLLVGIQVGIIVIPGFMNLNPFLQINLVMGYWAIVAGIFGAITRTQIRQSYDKPMSMLSSAAKQVAEGDFSVYVKPLHTADKYDYIDVMFLDFNTMVQELGSIETLKNDFVSNVSHEIKTPLAVIKNYTTMLKNKNLDENTQDEYISTIIKAMDNLSALVSNILKLNKLDNGGIDGSAVQYDVCRQLSECILNFESLWEEKNIKLSVNIEDKAIITADENMVEIVWNNLLSNALKFTEHGGTVAVSQTSDSNSIRVTISDSGCGMDKETLKRVFDKFYQGDTSRSGEGNGLGLALAYRVIDKIHGTITATSELGKGSTFTVNIPIQI